jgi:hypothetical protein
VVTKPLGVGPDVGGYEAVVLHCALQGGEHVRRVGSVLVLGQLGSAEEAVGVEGDLLGDRGVHVLGPKLQLELREHLAEHQERARPDDLDVDVALVHVSDVACRSSAVLLLGESRHAR